MTGQSTVPWFPRCQVPPRRFPNASLALESSPIVSTAEPSSRACPTRRRFPHNGDDERSLCCLTERLLCWPSPTTTIPLVRMHASQRSASFALDTAPPRGGFVSSIRGTSMNNFHACISCSTLRAARALAASWKLRRSAVLKAPFMTLGTTRIKQPLFLNLVSKSNDLVGRTCTSGSDFPPTSSSISSPLSLSAGVWMAWNSHCLCLLTHPQEEEPLSTRRLRMHWCVH